MLSTRQVVLILLPAVLLATTHLAFQTLVAVFGLKLGYPAVFLFYWIVGGFLLSWWLTGTDQRLRLFHDAPNNLSRPAWLGAWIYVRQRQASYRPPISFAGPGRNPR